MSVEYSAVAAKLKAMYSRFLTVHDYEELLSKKSVVDICVYLKATEGYNDALEGVNERNIHRGAMELMLEQDIMEEFIRLYNFVDKSKRDFLEFWFMNREIEFLKREISYIYTHEERNTDELEQSKFDAFFETHTKIKRSIMQNARSLSDCINACADTPYARILQSAENLDADFFAIGMMLDTFYYSSMWREAKKKLKGEQRKLFEKLIGTKIDMQNLMWVYRIKKYFKFDIDIIFTYLLPIRHRLSEDALRQIVNASDANAVVNLVNSLTPYGKLFEGIDEGRFPEENYRRLYNKLSKRIFVNHSESLVAIYAYLNLKEVELNNITAITEGVRYSLDTDSIREHIGI